MIDIAVQQEDFDSAALIAALEARGPGAVASFTGLVRGDGGLLAMTLEHWPGRTEAALQQVAAEAMQRWPLSAIVVRHRHGRMVPGERIVLVATASAHRAAALESCAYVIDRLKTDAPFWKKEQFADGEARWVEARQADDAARARWG